MLKNQIIKKAKTIIKAKIIDYFVILAELINLL
jgi:hypothetical protein